MALTNQIDEEQELSVQQDNTTTTGANTLQLIKMILDHKEQVHCLSSSKTDSQNSQDINPKKGKLP